MKHIYVAGPFRGDSAWAIEENIRVAETFGLEICKLGAVALVPHTMYRYFQGALPDAFWIEATLEILRRCDASFFVPRWVFSTGAKGERAECYRLDLPVLDSLVDVQEWLKNPDAYWRGKKALEAALHEPQQVG